MKLIKICFLILNIIALQNNTMLVNLLKTRNFNKETYFFAQKSAYIKGGIKFVYPVKYFSKEPFVNISIELNQLKSSADLILSPIIISNNKDEIDIKVNKVKANVFGNSVREANDNDVNIYIFAVGS